MVMKWMILDACMQACVFVWQEILDSSTLVYFNHLVLVIIINQPYYQTYHHICYMYMTHKSNQSVLVYL